MRGEGDRANLFLGPGLKPFGEEEVLPARRRGVPPPARRVGLLEGQAGAEDLCGGAGRGQV
jgi:hypothetical protein